MVRDPRARANGAPHWLSITVEPPDAARQGYPPRVTSRWATCTGAAAKSVHDRKLASHEFTE